MIESGNSTNNASFMELVQAIVKYTLKSINVMKVAKVVKINNGKYDCELIDDKRQVQCEKFSESLEVVENDIVLIAFVDTDFRTNLYQLEHNGQTIQIDEKSYHSINYGLIVANRA